MSEFLKALDLNRPANQIIEQLDRVRRRFPDDIDLKDFDGKVRRGEIQVFPCGKKSVMVGKACDDKTVWIVAAAGDLQELLDFEPLFCEWYEAHGYKRVLLKGREGWQKLLKNRGWHLTDYDAELAKELNP